MWKRLVPYIYTIYHVPSPYFQAASVKKAVKRGLTQRLRERVGMGDTDSDTDSSDEEKSLGDKDKKRTTRRKILDTLKQKDVDDGTTATDGGTIVGDVHGEGVDLFETHYDIDHDLEKGVSKEPIEKGAEPKKSESKKSKIATFQLPKVAAGMTSMSMLEQSMPADAVLTKEGAAEVSGSIFRSPFHH